MLKLIAVNRRVGKGVWPGFTGKWVVIGLLMVVIGLLVSEMKGPGLVWKDQ